MYLTTSALASQAAKPNQSLPLKIIVQAKYIGAIIGHGGCVIRDIAKTSQARCVVDVQTQTYDELGNQENTIVISGPLENCSKACMKIMQIIHGEVERERGNGTIVELKIRVLNDLIGRLIGKGGSSVKAIMEATGATISINKANQSADYGYYPILPTNISSTDRTVTIRGNSLDVVADAERKISQKLRHYYEADAETLMKCKCLQYTRSIGKNAAGSCANLSPMLPFPSPLVFLNSPTMYANGDCATSHYRLSNLSTTIGGGSPASAPPMMLCHSPKVTVLPSPVHLKTRIYVPSCFVGSLIGSKGSYIRSMMQFTGATISIEGGSPKERRKSAEAKKQIDKDKDSDEKVDPDTEEKKENVKSAAGDASDSAAKSTPEKSVKSTPEKADLKADAKKEKVGKTSSPCKKKSISSFGVPGEEVDRCVSISGYDFQVYKAEYFIFKRIADSSHCYLDELILSTETVVPNKIIGRIVGKNGRNLLELQAITHTRIQVHDRGAAKKSDPAIVKEEEMAQPQETAVGVMGTFISLQAVQSRFCNLINESEMNESDAKTRISTSTSLLSPLVMAGGRNEMSNIFA